MPEIRPVVIGESHVNQSADGLSARLLSGMVSGNPLLIPAARKGFTWLAGFVAGRLGVFSRF